MNGTATKTGANVVVSGGRLSDIGTHSRALASALITTFTRPLLNITRRMSHGMPRHCKMATIALIIAVIIGLRFFSIWALLAATAAMLVIWHALSQYMHYRVQPEVNQKVTNQPMSKLEPFYNVAPHDMVVSENPVFAHDAELANDDRAAPWRANEGEVADGVRELQQLTPPELLDAVQTNVVSIEGSTQRPRERCAFPTDFHELGERLG